MNWKRKFALLAVPAVLALGGGALAVQAAQTPSPPAPASQAGAEPAETTGAAETVAAETVEPNEPALPGGGHADTGANDDHQFEGIE